MLHLKHRTFEGIKANSDAYQARFADPSAAASRRHLRDFFNSEFGPIAGVFPKTGRVIDFIPLSELHLLLGIVNKLFDEFAAARRCSGITALWRNQLSVSQAAYRSEFNGNDCAMLISEHGVQVLASLIATDTDNVSSRVHRRRGTRAESVAERNLRTFRRFGEHVRGIFGATLSADWKDLIAAFRNAYLSES